MADDDAMEAAFRAGFTAGARVEWELAARCVRAALDARDEQVREVLRAALSVLEIEDLETAETPLHDGGGETAGEAYSVWSPLRAWPDPRLFTAEGHDPPPYLPPDPDYSSGV